MMTGTIFPVDSATHLCAWLHHPNSKIMLPQKVLIDCAKALDYVDHNKPWKILQEMGIPDYLTS